MDKQKQQGKGNKTNSSYLENGLIFTLLPGSSDEWRFYVYN